MKTILTAILLACGSALAAECDVQPRLTTQYYPAYPDPPATDVLLVVWKTMCPLWRIETSTNLVDWLPYDDWYYNQCEVTNGYQTNCTFHIIERPAAKRQQFYRLRLAPGLPN